MKTSTIALILLGGIAVVYVVSKQKTATAANQLGSQLQTGANNLKSGLTSGESIPGSIISAVKNFGAPSTGLSGSKVPPAQSSTSPASSTSGQNVAAGDSDPGPGDVDMSEGYDDTEVDFYS